AEIQDHHGVLFGAGWTSRRMAVKGDQLAALQRLLPVVERLAAAQSPAHATQLTEAPVDTNERRAKFIIEIFPVRVAPQVHAGEKWIERVPKGCRGWSPCGNCFGLIEEVILPRAVGVCVAQNVRCSP